MAHRIFEALTRATALPPVSVESASETSTPFMDLQSVETVEFTISTASMTSGKKLTVELIGADSANGKTNPVSLGKETFTLGSTGPVTAVISYMPQPQKRYVGLKLQHDAGSGVAISVLAEAKGLTMPTLDQGYTLVI